MAKHKKIKARLARIERERDLLWDALDQLYTELQAPSAKASGKHHLNLERKTEWIAAWQIRLAPDPLPPGYYDLECELVD
jgi:hypothetical protein